MVVRLTDPIDGDDELGTELGGDSNSDKMQGKIGGSTSYMQRVKTITGTVASSAALALQLSIAGSAMAADTTGGDGNQKNGKGSFILAQDVTNAIPDLSKSSVKQLESEYANLVSKIEELEGKLAFVNEELEKTREQIKAKKDEESGMSFKKKMESRKAGTDSGSFLKKEGALQDRIRELNLALTKYTKGAKVISHEILRRGLDNILHKTSN